jgi:hypothetical protein
LLAILIRRIGYVHDRQQLALAAKFFLEFRFAGYVLPFLRIPAMVIKSLATIAVG